MFGIQIKKYKIPNYYTKCILNIIDIQFNIFFTKSYVSKKVFRFEGGLVHNS